MIKVGTYFRQRLCDSIKEGIKNRQATFLVGYAKISSGQMNEIRKNLKKVGVKFFVSKNTITQRALRELNFPTLADRINGPTALIWADADSVEVSRSLVKLAKDYEGGILIGGGLFEGKILEQDDIKRLSQLPSKTILLTMLLGTLQSPLVRLAGALSGKLRELAYLLQQLSERKGGK